MRILMIEDDASLCEAVSVSLIEKGHQVDLCYNGADGYDCAISSNYDCILLDRMLPEMDGLMVLKKLREKAITSPVILVTAMNGVGDRVDGLDTGADDYLVKPFAMEELLARIRALSRRPIQWESTNQIRFSDIEFDPEVLTLKGKIGICTLSKREGQLMEFLLKNQNQVLPRTLLLSRVWGPYAPVEDGNLDNYIHFLRRRLKTVGSRIAITTVRGVGYRLESDVI